MEIKEIKRLLDAFYAGNTTLEEEKTLMHYFCSEKDIPKEFETDKEIFGSMAIEKERDVMVPDNLEQRLTTHIDNLAKRVQRRYSTIKINWKKTISIAASVAILIGCGIYINYSNPDKKVQPSSSKQMISNVIVKKDSQNVAIKIKQSVPIIASNEPIVTKKSAASQHHKIERRFTKAATLKNINHPIKREGTVEDAEKAFQEIAQKLKQVDSKCSYAQNKIDETNTEIYTKLEKQN